MAGSVSSLSIKTFFLSCLLLVAFWPVWQWFIERYLDKSDEPLGILALLTFIGLVVYRWRKDHLLVKSQAPLRLAFIAALLAYLLSWFWAPKAVHALFAVTSVGLFFASLYGIGVADWILLYLTLPVVATVNFYFGYPMRIVMAYFASLLLHCLGYGTTVEGTSLIWNSHYIEVDAPCSGIKMLWFSIYLAATMSSFLKFRIWQTTLLLSCSALLAIVGNGLRVTLLFFLENQLLPITASWAHQAIGVSLFAATTLGLGLIGWQITRTSKIQTSAVVSAAGQVSPFIEKSLYALCLVAALIPFVPLKVQSGSAAVAFPGWPETFQGQKISQLPDDEMTREFGREFPGRIGFFTNGREQICLRWVAHETRQLHSSSDCYRGLGYSIRSQPPMRGNDGSWWTCFEAEKGSVKLLVKERISDSAGNSWDDVSGWYWSALLQQCKPPWWAVTVVRRIQ